MIPVKSETEDQSLAYIMLKTAISQFEKTPVELSASDLDLVRQRARVQYKIQSIVLKTDEARDVSVPDASLQAAIDEVRGRYANYEDFTDDLIKHGIEYDDFVTSVSRELHVDAVLDQVASRAADVSDIDCRIYYHIHQKKFVSPEKRTLRHILITRNDDFAENTREQALKRINKLLAKVQLKPGKFEQIAMKNSECPSALNGGLLGDIVQGTLYPELDKVAFRMAKGDVSKVIETEAGFHILRCDAINPGHTVSLKEALPKIEALLNEKQKKNCQKNWLAQKLKSFN